MKISHIAVSKYSVVKSVNEINAMNYIFNSIIEWCFVASSVFIHLSHLASIFPMSIVLLFLILLAKELASGR